MTSAMTAKQCRRWSWCHNWPDCGHGTSREAEELAERRAPTKTPDSTKCDSCGKERGEDSEGWHTFMPRGTEHPGNRSVTICPPCLASAAVDR